MGLPRSQWEVRKAASFEGSAEKNGGGESRLASMTNHGGEPCARNVIMRTRDTMLETHVAECCLESSEEYQREQRAVKDS